MKKYQIIYADPPWEYKSKGGRSSAEQHYPVMSTKDICSLDIKSLKTDNAICFMWATFPNISEALEVFKSWGFIYKTAGFVWIKKNSKSGTNFFGMGAYTRANAEVCLIGVSPNTRPRDMIKDKTISQIIESPIQQHSKKPGEVREKIIRLCGDLPRIELFAREKFEGWDVYGNEVMDSICI